MVDPRKACLLMKRPKGWRKLKKPNPEEHATPRTYQFTPRGDTDSFVKFFAGDVDPGQEPEK